MKRLIFTIFVTLVFCFSFTAIAQEDPDPTEPVVYADPALDFEISWNSSGQWNPLIVTTVTFANEPVPTGHVYVDTLGLQTMKAMVDPLDTDPNPLLCTFTFNIDSLPRWWSFYRVHWRIRTDTMVSPWSEPSYWVLIINIPKPGRPVH